MSIEKEEIMDELNQYLRGLSEEDLKAIGYELKLIRLSKSEGLDWYDFGHSLSYYSKLENGKIIPKYEVIAEICEERGIEEKEIQSLILSKEILKKALPSIYYQDKEYLEKEYHNLVRFKNARANIVCGLHYLMEDRTDDVFYIIMYLEPISSGLEPFEFQVLNYLKLWYARKVKDFQKIKSCVQAYKNVQNEYLDALVNKEVFYAICEYGLDDPKFYYDKLLMQEAKLLSQDTKNVVCAYYKASIGYGYEVSTELLERLPLKLRLKYHLLHNNEDVLCEMLNLELSDVEKLYIRLCLNQTNEAKSLVESLLQQELSLYDAMFVNWAYAYLTRNIEEELKFLSKAFLPHLFKQKDGFLFMIFFKRLKTLSKDTAKYKSLTDAMEMYEQLQNNRILCSL